MLDTRAAMHRRCTRNRDNRKAIFLASRYVALGRRRDLPILTLRLPFSIAFFSANVARRTRGTHTHTHMFACVHVRAPADVRVCVRR